MVQVIVALPLAPGVAVTPEMTGGAVSSVYVTVYAPLVASNRAYSIPFRVSVVYGTCVAPRVIESISAPALVPVGTMP